MERIKVELELPKETTELAIALATFASDLKKAAADGLNADDLTAIITSASKNIVPALEGISLLPDELKEDQISFVMAFAYAGKMFYETAIK